MGNHQVRGNIVDLTKRTIEYGTLTIAEGVVVKIEREGREKGGAPYLLPGFVDAHVHIESSMLVPSEFARLAVVHGTVATISDPHEIANVCGIEGVRYMIASAARQPLKVYFGASPCVPATAFETAGAALTAADIETLFSKEKLLYMSEMMNYPGVLARDSEVMEKIAIAKKYGRPIDGHAPGLMGEEAKSYIAAGISTDHECFTLEEALSKLSYGMKVIIREGSAAKNFDALHPLIASHPKSVMFCSDDKHPDALVEGHINQLVKRALALGYDLFDVLTIASKNTIEHYGIPVGMVREGDPADFIVVDSIEAFNVKATYIEGLLVAEDGASLLKSLPSTTINHFSVEKKSEADFALEAKEGELSLIEALDGELITKELRVSPKVEKGLVVSDIDRDILKISVVNRYRNSPPAIAFVKNFGLKRGAIASTVAHDSHNIIAVGVDDRSICSAVNALIDAEGGVALCDGDDISLLPLPVAGLMSAEDGYRVAEKYSAIDRKAKELGSTLQAPFMTLSFMALLVIPEIKLSDKGLFDCKSFSFTSPFIP